MFMHKYSYQLNQTLQQTYPYKMKDFKNHVLISPTHDFDAKKKIPRIAFLNINAADIESLILPTPLSRFTCTFRFLMFSIYLSLSFTYNQPPHFQDAILPFALFALRRMKRVDSNELSLSTYIYHHILIKLWNLLTRRDLSRILAFYQ